MGLWYAPGESWRNPPSHYPLVFGLVCWSRKQTYWLASCAVINLTTSKQNAETVCGQTKYADGGSVQIMGCSQCVGLTCTVLAQELKWNRMLKKNERCPLQFLVNSQIEKCLHPFLFQLICQPINIQCMRSLTAYYWVFTGVCLRNPACRQNKYT